MPNYHESFLPGEGVRFIQDVESVLEIQNISQFTKLPKLSMISPIVTIERVTYFHDGLVLYKLLEIDGFWQENLFEDPSLDVDSSDPNFNLASQDYTIKIKRNKSVDHVCVEDRQGRLHLMVSTTSAETLQESMIEVSRVRSRIGFDFRYKMPFNLG